MRKVLNNLQSNILLLFSFSGLMGLSLGMEEGIQRICFVLLIMLLGLCVLQPCKVPLTRSAFKNPKAVALAASVEFVFLLCFYKTFVPGVFRSISVAIGVDVQWICLAAGFCLCVLGFYAVYVLCVGVLSEAKPVIRIVKKYRKSIMLLTLIFCLSLIAIIRADFDYIDDMYRIQHGNQLTGGFSRFIASFLSTFLHANLWLTDISPIPQLLAACVMAVVCVVLYGVMTDEGEMNVWGILSLIPLGVFPLFLQCYSYKYDAPYMALSVLFSVVPLIYRGRGRIRFAMAVAVGTVLMCTTYQASSGILPMLTVAVLLKQWSQKESARTSVAFVLTAAAGYIVGMLLFRFFLMDATNDSYVNTRISLAAIVPNLTNMFTLITKWFTPVWLLLMGIIVLGYLYVTVRVSKCNHLLTLVVSVCAVATMLILALGVYIVFENPLLYPRAMYGMGIFLVICCVGVSKSDGQWVPKAAVFLLGCSFFVFSFTYGNVLKSQKEYTQLRMEQVLSDLKELDLGAQDQKEEKILLRVVGTVGNPKQLEGTFREYPLLEMLTPVQLSDSTWYWGNYQLLHYSGLDDRIETANGADFKPLNLPLVVDHAYHTIWADETHILIELK